MEKISLTIYSKKNTHRLQYILEIIFNDILGVPWQVVTDRKQLGKSPVINYSEEIMNDAFNVFPSGLLFETDIQPVKINDVALWHRMPVFFCNEKRYDLPFDIFSASFYLITRYEEYGNFKADVHGRFPASASLAFKYGFLNVPIVDKWAWTMASQLAGMFPDIVFRTKSFKSLLTIDVDQPFAYMGKSFLRNMIGAIKDITVRKGNIVDRLNVMMKGTGDPYDTFDYIDDVVRQNGTNVFAFFPVGDFSKYDRNPSWKSKEYRTLIRRAVSRHNIGLHQSYNTLGNVGKLEMEWLRLYKITGCKAYANRSHFIRLSMPRSYCDLENVGITADFSMGYPEETGFRAGIARPFYFYNLKEERKTNLEIIPFQVMDGTLYNYKKMDVTASLNTIKSLICATKEVGGFFVSIWHNTSLLDNEEWLPWRMVFEKTVEMQK